MYKFFIKALYFISNKFKNKKICSNEWINQNWMQFVVVVMFIALVYALQLESWFYETIFGFVKSVFKKN